MNVITKGNGNYAVFFHWSAVVEIAFYTVEPFAEGVAVLIYEPESARRRLAVRICGNVGNFSGTISNAEVFSVVENDISQISEAVVQKLARAVGKIAQKAFSAQHRFALAEDEAVGERNFRVDINRLDNHLSGRGNYAVVRAGGIGKAAHEEPAVPRLGVEVRRFGVN